MQLKLTFNSYHPRKIEKRKKNFIFGWYMPIINKTPVHHIAQFMNILKPRFHFPIEEARSVS